ncbi:MAG: sugar ABC transporter ATP-binding protein [Sphaerochaetaceae bacterium]
MSYSYKGKTPVVDMRQISKAFPGVQALSDITFDLYEGEIHCLVGENGAGKSTLMKVLSGAYAPDGGEITIDGNTYEALTPKLSQELGVGIIYQENDLIPTMSVAENMFVGLEKVNRFGFLDRRLTEESARLEVEKLGIDLDVRRKIEDLSVAEQQFVKVLKALVLKPRILLMDEPTSMFNVKDVGKVLDLTQRVAKQGISIIYISHFLKEVVQIADRITVIRDGVVVNTYKNATRDIDLNIITTDMVGRSVDMFYIKERHAIGPVVLEVKDLQLTKDSPKVSFEVREGEILGLAGMVGSGRTELVRALTGADRFYGGSIKYKGEHLTLRSPKDSIDQGFAHITEDRQQLGLMLGQSILENMTIVGLGKKIKEFFFKLVGHQKLVAPLVEDLSIRTPSLFQQVQNLSGGNQQKVVLGKWLFAESDFYVFDEPTRGIDVNSKAEFYQLMSALTKEGKSIIMVSSDMPELISLSDRVLVVRKGEITGEIPQEEISEERIIKSALGM